MAVSKHKRNGTVYNGSATAILLKAIRSLENGSKNWVPYVVKQSRIGCVIKARKNIHIHWYKPASGVE